MTEFMSKKMRRLSQPQLTSTDMLGTKDVNDKQESEKTSLENESSKTSSGIVRRRSRRLNPTSGNLYKALSGKSMTLPSFKRQKRKSEDNSDKRKLSTPGSNTCDLLQQSLTEQSEPLCETISTKSKRDIVQLESTQNRPLPPPPDELSIQSSHTAVIQTLTCKLNATKESKQLSPIASECNESTGVQRSNGILPSNFTDGHTLSECINKSNDSSGQDSGAEIEAYNGQELQFECEKTQHTLRNNSPQTNSAQQTQLDSENKLQELSETNCETSAATENTSASTEQSDTPCDVADLVTLSEIDNGPTKSYTLKDALQNYENEFPLRIKIIQGYCTEESEHNLSTDDVYDIHFVKHTRTISLKDKDGYNHQIPLASAMAFGIVYNPHNDYDQALSGYKFERCSDILTSASMPKVVCALKTSETTDEKSSVSEHEIFAILGPQKSKFRVKRGLRVFSFLENREKVLQEDCLGDFSTNPSLIRLHLSQIVEWINNPFPSQAVLYFGPDTVMINGPYTSLSGVITLCDCSTETSMVASPVVNDQDHNEEHKLTFSLTSEILQIEVEVIQSTSKNDLDEDIYDDTLDLSRDNSQFLNGTIVEEAEETYATVGHGLYIPIEEASETDEIEEYDTVPFELPDRESQDLHTKSSETLKVERLELALENLTTRLETLESQIESYSQKQIDDTAASSSPTNQDSGTCETELAALNEEKIIDLLMKMDLSQYIPTFKAEHITGDILAECDEEVLKLELGVNSRVHRLRLLKVINGKSSK